jgi:hypothetical protein
MIFIHKKTGKKYHKLRELMLQFDGVWHQAVLYMSHDNREQFVRTKEDFERSFE